MTPFVLPYRDDRKLAWGGAVLLHALFAIAVIFAARQASTLPSGSVIPIEIVSSAPSAAHATPAPPAPVPVPSPEPVPTPTPPQKAQAAVPQPPAPPVPVTRPSTPTPSRDHARPGREFSLDALAASIAKAAHGGGAPPPAVQRRAAAPAAPAAASHAAAAASVSASDMEGLQQLLERLWNPDCSVAGADSIVVPVRFTIGPSGRVIGRVAAQAPGGDPAAAAAARRAIDAVHQAEPYAEPYRDQSFTVNFDAKTACSQP